MLPVHLSACKPELCQHADPIEEVYLLFFQVIIWANYNGTGIIMPKGPQEPPALILEISLCGCAGIRPGANCRARGAAGR